MDGEDPGGEENVCQRAKLNSLSMGLRSLQQAVGNMGLDGVALYVTEYHAFMEQVRDYFLFDSWKRSLRKEENKSEKKKKRRMKRQPNAMIKRKRVCSEEKLPWGQVILVSSTSDDDKTEEWGGDSPDDKKD